MDAENQVSQDQSGDAHVDSGQEAFHDLAAEDSDDAIDLFGPDSDDEVDLEDGPGSPHHEYRERTRDGVRVHVEDGRVLASEMSPDAKMETTQSPPRGMSARRRRVESDDGQPNDVGDSATSKRGMASNDDDMGGDNRPNVME